MARPPENWLASSWNAPTHPPNSQWRAYRPNYDTVLFSTTSTSAHSCALIEIPPDSVKSTHRCTGPVSVLLTEESSHSHIQISFCSLLSQCFPALLPVVLEKTAVDHCIPTRRIRRDFAEYMRHTRRPRQLSCR